MTTSKRVAAVLQRALDKIQKYGWIKNSYGSRNRGFCMAGAISASTSDFGLFVVAQKALGVGYPPYFNDKIARTKREVVSVFKRAIREQAKVI